MSSSRSARLVHASVTHRRLVLALVLVLVVIAGFTAARLKLDALPDLSLIHI